VTVPSAELPPITVVGLKVTPAIAAPWTLSCAVSVVLPSEAEIVTVAFVVTAVVVILNVAEELPPERLTRQERLRLCCCSKGNRNPGRTGGSVERHRALRSISPVTAAGTVTEASPAGVTDTVPEADPLESLETVILAEAAESTADAVTVNVPVFEPAATEIVVGMLSTLLELDKLTVTPPVGAAEAKVTVPARSSHRRQTREAKGGYCRRLNRERGQRVWVKVKACRYGLHRGRADAGSGQCEVCRGGPPGIVTVAGTFSVESGQERATARPLAGAGLSSVTVPVMPVPSVTAVALKLKAFRWHAAIAMTLSPALTYSVPS